MMVKSNQLPTVKKGKTNSKDWPTLYERLESLEKKLEKLVELYEKRKALAKRPIK